MGAMTRTFVLLSAGTVFLAVLLSIVREPVMPKRPPQPTTGRNGTILFLSNSEHGLANVNLATIYTLLKHHSAIDIHYASFAPLSNHTARISKTVGTDQQLSNHFTFHKLDGPTYWETLGNQGHYHRDIIHEPGLVGSGHFARDMPRYVAPWDASTYWNLYQQISGIVDETNPSLLVLDMLLNPAVDVARERGLNHAYLMPTTHLDAVTPWLPWGQMFWKYPTVSSGYPFPLPWYLIPANIWVRLRIVFRILLDRDLADKKSYLRERGLQSPIDVLRMPAENVVWVTQSTAEFDFPVATIPDTVVPCGPISLTIGSAAQQDPEMASWLSQAPTVLISLGSTYEYDEESTRAMATAVRTLLDHTGLQVLWKFKKSKDNNWVSTNDMFSNISSYVGSRLRIESWIKIDPTAILESENVVLLVHHGGSSTYHEAIENGVPQVVLPMWADCYDTASRIEYLGIGIWASKATPLKWNAEELSQAFMDAIGDSDYARMVRTKAKQLSTIIKRGKPGRLCAADELIKLATVDTTPKA